MYLQETLVLLMLLSFDTGIAFQAAIVAHRPRRMAMTAIKKERGTPQASFDRAVECSKTIGLCDVDELWKLADELEAFQEYECFYENKKDSWLVRDTSFPSVLCSSIHVPLTFTDRCCAFTV